MFLSLIYNRDKNYDKDKYDINKAAKDVAEATKKGAQNK